MHIRNLIFLLPLGIFLAACTQTTTTTPVFDTAKQARIDDDTLQSYFKRRNLLTDSGLVKTSSGLYYRITKAIPDSILAKPDSLIPNPDYHLIDTGNVAKIRYEGRLLNDTIFGTNLFDAQALDVRPGSKIFIPAFEEGVLYFKKGEEGYIYAPSVLAYGNTIKGKIPLNSCLRFFIRVTNVQ